MRIACENFPLPSGISRVRQLLLSCSEGVFTRVPPAWRAAEPTHTLLSYRHKRKNCAVPDSGTVTCQVLLLESDGTFVSVVQPDWPRLVLTCTENPAFASGQFNTTVPD